MEGVTAYTAGAGTGKTYQICEIVTEALAQGDPVDPSSVIATTFTNRAAAELKSRIQARILAEDDLAWEQRMELAEGLELAPMGTVHSVARRLLQRYALHLGLSPRLQPIDTDAAERHLEALLGERPPKEWERLAQLGRPLDLPDARDLTMELLKEKRTNRISDEDFLASMAKGADRVCRMLAPDGPDPQAPDPARLAQLAEQALERVSAHQDDTKATRDSLRTLRQLRYATEPTWKDIVTAARLKAGASADPDLDDLRTFASQVHLIPQLHEDIRSFTRALAQQTLRIEADYQAYKRNRGLLDFTDLEVLLLDALEDETIREDLAGSFSMVLVDEFQDSNPIQLAIFIKLHEIVGESYWVGDEKQSIYGFRDADLDLARSALELVEDDAIEELNRSYRSQTGLVKFLNRIFEPVFGPESNLEPHRPDDGASIERWFLDVRNKDQEARALADGIRALNAEGHAYGQMAILTRSNFHKKRVAGTLESFGIPTVVERPGLLNTREGALIWAGLAIAADPTDTLGSAEILHLLSDPTQTTPDWIIDRLEQSRNEEGRLPRRLLEDNPVLARIHALDAKTLTPSMIPQEVIRALDLPKRVATWGAPEIRSANLDKMVNLAHTYEDECAESGRGASLRGLLAWLGDLQEDEEDAVAAPETIDAVTVTTYHGAKGLEWDNVILTELEKTYDADPWEPEVEGGRAEEGEPLVGRELRFWPWPFGTNWSPYRGDSRVKHDLDTRAAQTEEGQVLQRRQVEERERLLYVGMTRARDKLVLTNRGDPDKGPRKTKWVDHVPHQQALNPKMAAGEHEAAALGTTIRIRHLQDPGAVATASDSGHAITIAAPPVAGLPGVPRYRRPSGAEAPPHDIDVQPERLRDGDPLAVTVDDDMWDAFGSAVHAYLAGLPSIKDLDAEAKRSVADRCLRRHGVSGAIAPQELVAAGGRLEGWVEKRWPAAEWHTEVPLTGPREEGGQWYGYVDLLLVTKAGEAIVVDHKVRPIPEELWGAEAGAYAGQLGAYRVITAAAGLPVSGTYIHFPFGGGVVGLDHG